VQPSFWRWLATSAQETPSSAQGRLRVRDLGVKIGVYQPGPLNAITDVAGVRVGQVTLVEADDVRTGVTAILPHDGNMLQDRVAAAVHAYNAFGKLVCATQVNELGDLETPVLLTNTLSVWDAARALAEWMLGLPGNQDVRSVNPVVGETNDGWLSDIRGMHVKAAHVIRALDSARGGPVDEGSVGAGTGTIALGWKGGIGTSSRKLPSEHGGFTLGVLVQSNFGGDFTLDGVPVWRPRCLVSAKRNCPRFSRPQSKRPRRPSTIPFCGRPRSTVVTDTWCQRFPSTGCGK